MRETRLGEAYHIERALAARQGITRYPCGCQKCHGFKSQLVQVVETHHRRFGRDITLLRPLLVSSLLHFQRHYVKHVSIFKLCLLTSFKLVLKVPISFLQSRGSL